MRSRSQRNGRPSAQPLPLPPHLVRDGVVRGTHALDEELRVGGVVLVEAEPAQQGAVALRDGTEDLGSRAGIASGTHGASVPEERSDGAAERLALA